MDYPERGERERSEPCSVRTNPFTDDDHASSRKRQRTSNGGSRSRSVDVARRPDIVTPALPLPQQEVTHKAESPLTPPHMPSGLPSEPTSSRVTINLRTDRSLESIPSSPLSPTTMTGREDEPRISVESESDALSTTLATETPSSSPSQTGSPQVELIAVEDEDSDFDNRDPVAIIEEDDVYFDPVMDFPYVAEGEMLIDGVLKIINFFQYEDIPDPSCFCKLRDWIQGFLQNVIGFEPFHDSYTKYRGIWVRLPECLWALSRRNKFFGTFLHDSTQGRLALSQLFHQFARLSGRFLHMDATILARLEKGDRDNIPELGSYPYISAFAFLLRKEESQHIGKNLEIHYNWNWDHDVAEMIKGFQAEGGTLKILTNFAREQLKLLSRTPKIIDHLADPCWITAKIVHDAAHVLNQQDRSLITNENQKLAQGFEFFKIMSTGFATVIKKHITNLTPDSAQVHLSGLYSILLDVMALDISAVHELLDNFHSENQDMSRKQVSKVIPKEWKFGILKKLIISPQMQLRVIGVTTMCQDLLGLYQIYKSSDVPSNPLLLYFANFVLQNELIEYIVGTGSHPEIINESSNILGFLIVTKTYNNELADKIWQTVSSSQNPGVVDAVIRMISRSLNLFDQQTLLYTCMKASDIPIPIFNSAMRDLCQRLFQELIQKFNLGTGFLKSPPYGLCVRLIRESSVSTTEAPGGFPDVLNFAAVQLRELLHCGPGPEGRRSIYDSCIKDVAASGPTASGSICVIHALLRQNPADVRSLATDHGLTRLLVEVWESVLTGDRRLSNPTVEVTAASLARRELLSIIITHEPATISPDLGKRLWNVLVGNEYRPVADRDTSWEIFNAAVKRSTGNNVFLNSCVKDRLPELPPSCFTRGALEFAQGAISTWLEEVRLDFKTQGGSLECQALEQLWRMILTAPDGTVEGQSINALVDIYLNSKLIAGLEQGTAKEIHLHLVNRCLQQLSKAATQLKAFSDDASSGSDEGMVIVASEGQFQEQEKIFGRSLAVLREFLKAYQLKPQFGTPKPLSPAVPASSNLEGEPLIVKYQSFDGAKDTEVKSLTLGKLNTAATLLASLQRATGFKNCKVYYRGREFPDEHELCQSLDDLNLNGLVLVQQRESQEGPLDITTKAKMSLEFEIMKHSDDLWGYLSMHEKAAQEIYYFLVKFPVYGNLLRDIECVTTSYSQIFPLEQPFKCLYAIHALREFINSSRKGAVNETVLTRAISLIIAAISDKDVLESCPSDELRDCIASHLIDCLVQLLKEPVLPVAIGPLLNNTLLDRLLYLLYNAKTNPLSRDAVNLTWRLFEAILEASLYSVELWKSLASHLKSTTLLRDLILKDPRPVIRKSALKQIMNKCSFVPSLSNVSTTEFTVAFWPLVAALIPETVDSASQSEETYTLAFNLFKKLAETAVNLVSLDDLVKQWGSILLSYSSTESVGHPESMDKVAWGLSNLLAVAVSFSKASQQTVSCGNLGVEIFRKHLFPHLSLDEDRIITPITPLLSQATRQMLSEAILFLVKDDVIHYRDLLENLSELVPYSTDSIDGPYVYDLTFLFERNRSIRSPTGYVGLKNLSNTCYLNSLFTQLFMNIPFRNFMLNANIADGIASQRLMSETQNLFSYMQNSLRRFIDPTNLAGSIRTYEDGNIDVSIQMDVDEFYNLVFDRWESQILAPDAKRQFRSFYGGQLVQQVKSKECSHISERLEHFSAIQCDIKGKTSLQESLQAYVDGEVMEGDNKYKCSTCDRHVDAVKRACLKDIPDNLIFHLKRFDFNLRTLQRSKINDYFQFPDMIDMKPYKVEHLMQIPEETPEDVFELVGVLIHSGTAESGHYYSFIRERPSSCDKENWVEFNDDCVSPWDPSHMEDSCYGGLDYRTSVDGNNISYDKSYSAYMLFYQRSSAAMQQKQALNAAHLSSPVTLDIPSRIANHIAMENELLIRKYCLYDPSHTVFVSKTLANIKHLNGGQCSETHETERLALIMALNHMDQVISRTKETPEFSNFMMNLRQICNSCAECSRDYLEWYCDCSEVLRHQLVRNPESLVRHEIASSILAALNKVRVDAAYAYGFNDESEESADEMDHNEPRIIQRIVDLLAKQWEIFHVNTRAWPEYFGLLTSIAKMGELEAVVLIEAGFLRRALEVVSADNALSLGTQYTKLLGIVSKRGSTNRPVVYDTVIDLLCQLLRVCDIEPECVPEDTRRIELALKNEPVPFSQSEQLLVTQHWTRSESHILTEKLLLLNQGIPATDIIITELLSWPPRMGIDRHIYHAITFGIKKGSASWAVGPFLRAAVMYCTDSQSENAVSLMIQHVSKAAYYVESTEGREFLQFFKTVATVEPKVLGETASEPLKLVTETCHLWAPALLTYYEGGIRNDTENFLSDICLSTEGGLGTSADEEERRQSKTITLIVQKLGIACLEYIRETYVIQRATAVRTVLLNIQSVIEACTDFFDEENINNTTRDFLQLKSSVLPRLRQYIVEEADDDVSDWEASDGEYPSSEPMDSIAELCGTDINDLETQV